MIGQWTISTELLLEVMTDLKPLSRVMLMNRLADENIAVRPTAAEINRDLDMLHFKARTARPDGPDIRVGLLTICDAVNRAAHDAFLAAIKELDDGGISAIRPVGDKPDLRTRIAKIRADVERDCRQELNAALRDARNPDTREPRDE